MLKMKNLKNWNRLKNLKNHLFNHQILAFKIVANPTQNKYGINKYPETLLILMNFKYVS